jgi:hypothetical protein
MSHRKRFGIAVAVACVFAMAAVVLGVIAFVQWGALQERQLNANWGSVPDWIAGVGTTLAFAAAVFVFWYETRDRSLTDRRSQAITITAWPTGTHHVEYSPPYDPNASIFQSSAVDPISGQSEHLSTAAEIYLINASNSVIYDLVVAVLCTHAPPLRARNDDGAMVDTEQMPWETRRDRVAMGMVQVLPPGEWKVHITLSNTSVRADEIALLFRDSRGNVWRRTPLGQLIELRSLLPDYRVDMRMQVVEDLDLGPTDAVLPDVRLRRRD